jgi:hypothetical protein
VISSARSESVKGVLTRVGSRITKGTLQLKLKTLPVMVIGIGGVSPFPLKRDEEEQG